MNKYVNAYNEGSITRKEAIYMLVQAASIKNPVELIEDLPDDYIAEIKEAIVDADKKIIFCIGTYDDKGRGRLLSKDKNPNPWYKNGFQDGAKAWENFFNGK